MNILKGAGLLLAGFIVGGLATRRPAVRRPRRIVIHGRRRRLHARLRVRKQWAIDTILKRTEEEGAQKEQERIVAILTGLRSTVPSLGAGSLGEWLDEAKLYDDLITLIRTRETLRSANAPGARPPRPAEESGNV
jgi:hypothetical protein